LKPCRPIFHYDDPKNKRPHQPPPSRNHSSTFVHKSYTDSLKNGIAKGGSIHDNTSTQPSKILPISTKTSSSSRSIINTSSSSPSDQSNNNATLNQILSCLTDIKQDIKTLKNDVFHFEQEQLKLIYKVDNIKLELESFGSPSYALDDDIKD